MTLTPGRSYYPDTATFEEAEAVIASLERSLRYAKPEEAFDLHDELRTWRQALADKLPAIEIDRRVDQQRDIKDE